MANEPAAEGSELLNKAMARRGMSAPDLAAATGGRVSSSSIRGYVRGDQIPRASTAVIIARTLGVDEGAPLLRSWGYREAAEALEEPSARVVTNSEALSYLIETDSSVPDRSVPLGWQTGIEVLGRLETSQGVEWLCRADSGTLLLVRPLFGLELSPSFTEVLHADTGGEENG